MCYSIPGKVVEISGKTAIIDYFGEKRKALNELVNVKIGDYIYAQGGFIINIVPEEEALEVVTLSGEDIDGEETFGVAVVDAIL